MITSGEGGLKIIVFKHHTLTVDHFVSESWQFQCLIALFEKFFWHFEVSLPVLLLALHVYVCMCMLYMFVNYSSQLKSLYL